MFEDHQRLIADILALLRDPQFWWQFLALVVAIVGASLINRRVQKVLQAQAAVGGVGFRHLAVRSMQRLLWPVSALAILLVTKFILEGYRLPVTVLDLAVPILIALALIRLTVYILRKAFTLSPLLKSSENFLALLIWCSVILHLLGWLPAVLAGLDSMALTIGESRISVLSGTKLVLMIFLAFTLALWLAALISNQVNRSTSISPSMQVGFSKFSRFILLTLAFLLALNAVGINLSSLAIFGGALGVGLGFGLQRIASNFISGFILVLDRSIKPGDVITIGDKFGWVEQLNSRYVVVRNREGVDTLIPNENLITSEVINWSYADRNVRVSIVVQISYDDNPEEAMELVLGCAYASPRVLKTPAPSVRLTDFADSGIELQLRVWMSDPENGSDEIRSDICIAIWHAFKKAGITIPFPQRDLHIKSGLHNTQGQTASETSRDE